MTSPDSPFDSAVLKLLELLRESSDDQNARSSLHFVFDAETNVTVVEVKSTGADARDLMVILPGINLTALGASDSEIIHQLLNAAKLNHG